MNFILTIDTEGDNQWNHGQELTVENLKFIPRFQDLCNQYQIKPTYLVTSEVCHDEFAKEIFTEYSSKGIAEIGAHLHSWTTPPFMDKEGFRYNDPNHAFASELPEYLAREKIKNLTGEITSSFGIQPLSFRSGRYGFNKMLGEILVENNYLVDSSVTPHTSWADQKGIPGESGGPDFIEQTAFPYSYFSNKTLIEIPVTILPTRFPLNRNKKISDFYFKNVDHNIPLRVIRKLFFKNQPVWLRPFPGMGIPQLEELISEAANIQLPHLVMMFHSSELMAGCSRYRPDEKSIEELYILLESLFILLQKKNIPAMSLTEAAKSQTR